MWPVFHIPNLLWLFQPKIEESDILQKGPVSLLDFTQLQRAANACGHKQTIRI